jgi:hypothetical protein
LHVIDLNIPVDDGLTFGESQSLIQIVYWEKLLTFG